MIAAPTESIIETRRQQMFPILEPAAIERVRRFGKVRTYGAGEALATTGHVGLGLTIVLAGNVDVAQRDRSGRRAVIVTYGTPAPGTGASLSKVLSPSRGRVCIIGRRRSKRSSVPAKRWPWWARGI